MKDIYRRELDWIEKMRRRPILTGGYMKPTVYNGPLPRMRPQPLHVSCMINRRRRARSSRLEKNDVLKEWRSDLKMEAAFEGQLADRVGKDGVAFDKEFSDNFKDWVRPISSIQATIVRSFIRDEARQKQTFPPEMLAQVKAARREKVANLTRQRQRELRGEVLQSTILRRRKGPPAHVLTTMTPEQRKHDKIARRSLTEVGYVGMIKRRLGFNLRNPDAWKVEDGKEENRKMLDMMEEEITWENERRRELVYNNEDKSGIESKHCS